MRLIVAGSSCSIPRPDRACSGYIVEDGKLTFALDYGTGVFANMRRHVDYDRLDAVIITHMHADHYFDVIPLRYALKYGSKKRAAKLALWLPPGGLQVLRAVADTFAPEGPGEFLDDVFDLREFDPAAGLRMGDGTITFAKTSHYIPTFATRYSHGERSLTYSADTAPDNGVVELAKGTDLFLCEATLLRGAVEGPFRGHCSATEAAVMAQTAGVKKLVLTHYAQEATAHDLAEATDGVFGGDVETADDHAIILIGSPAKKKEAKVKAKLQNSAAHDGPGAHAHAHAH